MIPKLSNLKLVLGYWNENMNQNFRFNNPKQFSNWIILVSFCSPHLAIKNYSYNVHFMKILKIQKSLCITTKTCTQIQTQLSRKLQRFRTCRKNKKCSIFHDLSEYIIFRSNPSLGGGHSTFQKNFFCEVSKFF